MIYANSVSFVQIIVNAVFMCVISECVLIINLFKL